MRKNASLPFFLLKINKEYVFSVSLTAAKYILPALK